MKKIVVAITGASGSIYAKLLIGELQKLTSVVDELSVVFTENAKQVWEHELGSPPILKQVNQFANNNFYAPFASGSSSYTTMVICPCSMGTLGRIANGISDTLITRAADVLLKENRQLILVPRETPYNLIHIENMKKLMLAGASICPATPSFYSKPTNIDAVALTVVERIISLLGIESERYKWGE